MLRTDEGYCDMMKSTSSFSVHPQIHYTSIRKLLPPYNYQKVTTKLVEGTSISTKAIEQRINVAFIHQKSNHQSHCFPILNLPIFNSKLIVTSHLQVLGENYVPHQPPMFKTQGNLVVLQMLAWPKEEKG